MTARPPRLRAILMALAIWCGLGLGAAIGLYALARPTGELPPMDDRWVFVYYALCLFSVPGLVFVPTVVASVAAPEALGESFLSIGFFIAVGLVNGICWAAMVAIGRASLRRRREEQASAAAGPLES